MPTHGGAHNADKETPEQHSRRSKRSCELCDDVRDRYERAAEGDEGIYADIEQRMVARGGPMNLGGGKRWVGCCRRRVQGVIRLRLRYLLVKAKE